MPICCPISPLALQISYIPFITLPNPPQYPLLRYLILVPLMQKLDKLHKNILMIWMIPNKTLKYRLSNII